MVFEKAAYWMAVGVLALIVSNNLASRHGINMGSVNIGSVPNRSFAAVEQVAGGAIGLVGTAEQIVGRAGTRFAHSQSTLACLQTRLASVQSRLAQREAVLARNQAQRARVVAMQQLRGTALCSR
jgi:hypothetical protein